jgi:hypothetical protein
MTRASLLLLPLLSLAQAGLSTGQKEAVEAAEWPHPLATGKPVVVSWTPERPYVTGCDRPAPQDSLKLEIGAEQLCLETLRYRFADLTARAPEPVVLESWFEVGDQPSPAFTPEATSREWSTCNSGSGRWKIIEEKQRGCTSNGGLVGPSTGAITLKQRAAPTALMRKVGLPLTVWTLRLDT